jgi:hypothetical protein
MCGMGIYIESTLPHERRLFFSKKGGRRGSTGFKRSVKVDKVAVFSTKTPTRLSGKGEDGDWGPPIKRGINRYGMVYPQANQPTMIHYNPVSKVYTAFRFPPPFFFFFFLLSVKYQVKKEKKKDEKNYKQTWTLLRYQRSKVQ